MANLKIKIEIEFDEEQVRDIFDSYDIKFSKKKLADLKRELKENPEWVRDDIESDIENTLGNIINELFGE